MHIEENIDQSDMSIVEYIDESDAYSYSIWASKVTGAFCVSFMHIDECIAESDMHFDRLFQNQGWRVVSPDPDPDGNINESNTDIDQCMHATIDPSHMRMNMRWKWE